MSSTGIFWIREDFRIENNPALSFATQNHDNVIALYIYNNIDFDNKREAQKWWVYKSLETLKKELSDYKINLEIVKGDELEIFSKFNKKDKLSVYWNKIYEPDVIAKGKKYVTYLLKMKMRLSLLRSKMLFAQHMIHREKSIEMNLYFMIQLVIHSKGQGYIQMAQLINYGKGKKLFLKGL